MSTDQFLHGVCAVILEQGLGKGRTRILSRQLEKKGGRAESQFTPTTTHLLVGNNVRWGRLPTLLGGMEVPKSVRVLRADWLSSCLTQGELLREEEYIVPVDSPAKMAASLSPVKLERGGGGGEGGGEGGGGEGGGGGIKEESVREDGGEVGKPLADDHGDVVKQKEGGEEKEKEKEEEEEEERKEGMRFESSDEEQKPVQRFPTFSRRWKTSPRKAQRDNKDSDSDYVESGGEGDWEEEARQLADVDTSAVPPLAKRKRRWICEIPASEAQSWVNHNTHITDKLQELVTVYQNSGEKWRAVSTTKVIQAVKKYPKEITTYEEARGLPFVGKRLADKIMEIVSSGGLRRLENVDKEKEAVISLFTNIHGVGQTTAHQFYAQGHRSIVELSASGVLNRQQRIGVKYYEEFQERMPREEVAEIEEQVRDIAHQINSGLEVITCGSYRRGKPTCGDVDILVTHPDGRSHRGILIQLMEMGRESGFLTDDLTIHHDQNGGGKYLGVCLLPGEGRKHRRIDIYVTPYSEFPCMLLHFTGSGHFNRSMRSKADKLGMSLSEHSLNTGVIRKKGVKVFDGTPVPVFSEADVFKYLDIPYCDPKDRDWD